MRFKELFSTVTGHSTPLIAGFGTNKFGMNIFNTAERTPHWEMRESLEILETRPQVNAGIKQICRFVIGDEISVESQDKTTVKYMKDWINNRPAIYTELYNLLFLGVGLGNAYVEPIYIQQGDKLKYSNFRVIPDSSRVYINMSPTMDLNQNYWIYTMPREVRYKDVNPSIYLINYIKGGVLFRESVFGIPFAYKHFEHFKIGWSRDGLYGRGYLSSTIDDNNILKEILKNIALIARYRALNTKLITPASEDTELIEDDIVTIENKFLNKRDEDHMFLNKALKVQSLNNTNEYDTMNNEIDFLRRDINAGLLPNYLTPWSQDGAKATASESKIPFMLELESIRKDLVNFLNESVLEKLKKDGAPIADDATFKLSGARMESYEERVQIGTTLYQNGVITFNELRKMVDQSTVAGGDRFNWQIKPDQDTMFGTKPMTTPNVNIKSNQEQFFTTHPEKKPRTRVCKNCTEYMPKKGYCKKNNWRSEGTDACNRFSKISEEDEQTTETT